MATQGIMQTLGLTVAGFVAFLVVHGAFLAKGQTLGKVLVGTRIVGVDAKPIPVPRLIGMRYGIPTVIHMLPYGIGGAFNLIDDLCVFTKQRRCIHDHLAGTWVIKADAKPEDVTREGANPIAPLR